MPPFLGGYEGSESKQLRNYAEKRKCCSCFHHGILSYTSVNTVQHFARRVNIPLCKQYCAKYTINFPSPQTLLMISLLAKRYPEAGPGSSYYFAEAAVLQREEHRHFKFARLSKFIVGWASHLYYWIYPGVMVAFMGLLITYTEQGRGRCIAHFKAVRNAAIATGVWEHSWFSRGSC